MSARPAAGAAIDISFIVAAHNVAPFIAEAVESALAQHDCRVEVIVVDDASRDETVAIVERLCERDGRVRLLRKSAPGGAAAARNTALDHAGGAWLAVLDGDDVILPERGRALLDAAAATSADLVADNLIRFGEGVRREAAVLPTGRLPYSLLVDPASYLDANRLLRPGPNLGYLKPMFRRSFMARHGLRYDERLRIGEDSQLCLETLLAGARFVVLSGALYRYRVRAGSLSWRLAETDIDAMATAFAPFRQRLEACGPETAVAARRYSHALDRARSIVSVVDAAKAGLLTTAAQRAWRAPATWGFLGAVSIGLFGRALRRLAEGRSRGSQRVWT